jgi:hypothetical protein
MNSGAAKIRMINASLRCFTFGLLALLPFIGIPFGIVALVYAGKARVAEKQFWNPARPYMMIGGTVASLCVILWTFSFILIVWNIMNPGPD